MFILYLIAVLAVVAPKCEQQGTPRAFHRHDRQALCITRQTATKEWHCLACLALGTTPLAWSSQKGNKAGGVTRQAEQPGSPNKAPLQQQGG